MPNDGKNNFSLQMLAKFINFFENKGYWKFSAESVGNHGLLPERVRGDKLVATLVEDGVLLAFTNNLSPNKIGANCLYAEAGITVFVKTPENVVYEVSESEIRIDLYFRLEVLPPDYRPPEIMLPDAKPFPKELVKAVSLKMS